MMTPLEQAARHVAAHFAGSGFPDKDAISEAFTMLADKEAEIVAERRAARAARFAQEEEEHARLVNECCDPNS